MGFLETILTITNVQMETPKMYGPFHIFFLVLLILSCIIVCHLGKTDRESFVRKLLLFSAELMLLLEGYKQINHTFVYDGTQITIDYPWYIFPFQFCSIPMYVCLIAYFMPKGKIYDSLCAFLATFSVFAGCCVMIYPEQVFIGTMGINLQTMICHGMMIVVGVYLLKTDYVPIKHKTITKAIPVFLISILMAMFLNEIAHISGLLESENFNMFFISPYCEPHLPVYSIVQAVIPFPWCTIIYAVVFSMAAYMMLLIAMSMKCLHFYLSTFHVANK